MHSIKKKHEYFIDNTDQKLSRLTGYQLFQDFILNQSQLIKIGVNTGIFSVFTMTWGYCYKNYMKYNYKWLGKFSIFSFTYCMGYWLTKELTQKIIQKNFNFDNIFFSHQISTLLVLPFFLKRQGFRNNSTFLYKYALNIQVYAMYFDFAYYYKRKTFIDSIYLYNLEVNQFEQQ